MSADTRLPGSRIHLFTVDGRDLVATKKVFEKLAIRAVEASVSFRFSPLHGPLCKPTRTEKRIRAGEIVFSHLAVRECDGSGFKGRRLRGNLLSLLTRANWVVELDYLVAIFPKASRKDRLFFCRRIFIVLLRIINKLNTIIQYRLYEFLYLLYRQFQWINPSFESSNFVPTFYSRILYYLKHFSSLTSYN